jgi:hypothetical protein
MRRPTLSGGSSVTAGNYVLHDIDRAGQAVLASGYDRVWLKKRPAIQLAAPLVELLSFMRATLTSVRRFKASGTAQWMPEPPAENDLPLEGPLQDSEPDLWQVYLCGGLLSLSTNHGSVERALDTRASSAASLPLPQAVLDWIGVCRELAGSSQGDLLSVIRAENVAWAVRLAAVAICLGVEAADPDLLIQAHAIGNVRNVVAGVDSESTLKDHAKTIAKLGGRAGVPSSIIDSAVAIVSERITEVEERTSEPKSPSVTAAVPPDGEAFDDGYYGWRHIDSFTPRRMGFPQKTQAGCLGRRKRRRANGGCHGLIRQ